MFDRLFRRAERKIDSVVAKYVRRIMVAVPLLVAALFATVAITVKLVEIYGSVYGYAIMAGGFAALSAVVALFALTGPATPVEQAEAAATDDAEKLKERDEAPFVPTELLSLITAAAPVALPGVARAAARNLPIFVVLAILGYLFARYSGGRDTPAGDAAAEAADAADAQDEAAAVAAAQAEAAARASATMATRAAAA